MIAQLKALFIQELQVLFPSVMSQLLTVCSKTVSWQNTLYVKLCAVNTEKFEEAFTVALKKHWLKRNAVLRLLAFNRFTPAADNIIPELAFIFCCINTRKHKGATQQLLMCAAEPGSKNILKDQLNQTLR